MNRPTTYTIAAIVQFLLSAHGIGSVPFLMRGATMTDPPPFLSNSLSLPPHCSPLCPPTACGVISGGAVS